MDAVTLDVHADEIALRVYFGKTHSVFATAAGKLKDDVIVILEHDLAPLAADGFKKFFTGLYDIAGLFIGRKLLQFTTHVVILFHPTLPLQM